MIPRNMPRNSDNNSCYNFVFSDCRAFEASCAGIRKSVCTLSCKRWPTSNASTTSASKSMTLMLEPEAAELCERRAWRPECSLFYSSTSIYYISNISQYVPPCHYYWMGFRAQGQKSINLVCPLWFNTLYLVNMRPRLPESRLRLAENPHPS